MGKQGSAPTTESSKLSYRDIVEILNILNSSQCRELHLKFGDLVIDFVRERENETATHEAPPPQQATPERTIDDQTPPTASASGVQATAASQQSTSPNTSSNGIPEHHILVKAPMVGTFYRAPEPGAPPFVEVGQEVSEDDTVCIIEVMKLMNSVPAGMEGTVSRTFVENGEPVEYGQPLMAIDPTNSASGQGTSADQREIFAGEK